MIFSSTLIRIIIIPAKPDQSGWSSDDLHINCVLFQQVLCVQAEHTSCTVSLMYEEVAEQSCHKAPK